MSELEDLTCQDFIGFLSDYIDGDLSEQQKCMFDEHLGDCQECRHYLDSYNKTMMLASSIATKKSLPEDVPAGLVEAIIATRRG